MTANAEKPCILVLTSTYPRWPGDKEPPFVHELSKRLTARYDVIVLAPHAASARSEETWDDVKIHRFRYFFENWQTLTYNGGILSNLKKNRLNLLLVPFFLCAQLIATVRTIRKYPVAVIHAHWIFPQGLIGLIGALLAGRKNTSLVCTSHGGDLFGLQGPIFSRIKQWVIRHSSALTVVSQAMKNHVNSMLGPTQADKVSVISMGVDLRRKFTPSSLPTRKQNELLFVGRLVEKKGLNYLIEAMPLILNRYPGTRLTIAGTGPELPSLERLAGRLKLENRISFLGAVHNDQLPRLYRSATIFVAPFVECTNGDQEGLGLVMIEALGCGCPVVASDMPAIIDVIVDGETGLLAQQRNPSDIADKIMKLLDSENLRDRLSQGGRNHVVDNFDWEFVAGRYSKLIGQLCATT